MYKALLGEITLIQAARDSLPNDVHIGALFDLELRRLLALAEARISPRRNPVGIVPLVKAGSDCADRLALPLAS